MHNNMKFSTHYVLVRFIVSDCHKWVLKSQTVSEFDMYAILELRSLPKGRLSMKGSKDYVIAQPRERWVAKTFFVRQAGIPIFIGNGDIYNYADRHFAEL